MMRLNSAQPHKAMRSPSPHTTMGFIKSIPSKWSLRLLYAFGITHVTALSYLAYQRNVVGDPMAYTWDKETGLRKLTRVEWLEQQARVRAGGDPPQFYMPLTVLRGQAAYRRAHHDPSSEAYQAILADKTAELRAECEAVGMDYSAIEAEHHALYNTGNDAAADKPILPG